MTWAIEKMGHSQRHVCGLIGLESKTYRYASTRLDDAPHQTRLWALPGERRRFGYRRLLILLRREGDSVNNKKFFRLCREESLTVRRRGGCKLVLGIRAPMTLPLAGGSRGRVALHRCREAATRRLRREPERPLPRLVPEQASLHGLALLSARSSRLGGSTTIVAGRR